MENQLLERLYYNLDSPALYGGLNILFREAKKHNPKIKIDKVRSFLQNQYVYTLHKPARRHFSRNKVIVPGPKYQYQIDLSDMQAVKDSNDGFQYIFTCIDVFSKVAWAIPIQNKTGEEIVRAFSMIIPKPRVVQSDEGKEFLNKKFQNYLEKNNIRFFTSKNRDIKCAIVERFNRTLKSKIWKHFSRSRKHRYIDVLPFIVSAYNNSYHRSIKLKPSKVNISNVAKVRETLYGTLTPNKNFKYNIGDKVRVSKIKGTFEKGYLPNWSEEIFLIRRRNPMPKPVYELEDYNKEKIEGMWYEKELQKVKQETFWIEKIIKRSKNKCLVKWFGYSEKFNSWISNKDIKKYG